MVPDLEVSVAWRLYLQSRATPTTLLGHRHSSQSIIAILDWELPV